MSPWSVPERPVFYTNRKTKDRAKKNKKMPWVQGPGALGPRPRAFFYFYFYFFMEFISLEKK